MLKMPVPGKHKGQTFSAWKIETRGTLHKDKNTTFYAGDSKILPQLHTFRVCMAQSVSWKIGASS